MKTFKYNFFAKIIYRYAIIPVNIILFIYLNFTQYFRIKFMLKDNTEEELYFAVYEKNILINQNIVFEINNFGEIVTIQGNFNPEVLSDSIDIIQKNDISSFKFNNRKIKVFRIY